ncbi:MAG: YnbE family lipoprotein [Pseudomonadota bacterium]
MELRDVSINARLVPPVLALMIAACSPTVQLVAPDEPIRIDLNVKIDQEVRLRLDQEVEDLIAENPDLF